MSGYKTYTIKDVVTVIVLLVFVSLSLAAVGTSGRSQAKNIVCQAYLKQWGTLFQAYAEDHNGNFNPGWDTGPKGLWMNALRPYYGDNEKIFICSVI